METDILKSSPPPPPLDCSKTTSNFEKSSAETDRKLAELNVCEIVKPTVPPQKSRTPGNNHNDFRLKFQ